MKRYMFAAFLLTGTLLTSCGSDAKTAKSLAGKTFCYENEGFGGAFSITLDASGGYTYYEGGLSSYYGSGTWTVENGILTMTDQPMESLDGETFAFVNHFAVAGNVLRYQEQDSTNFLYVKVRDGEQFTAAE